MGDASASLVPQVVREVNALLVQLRFRSTRIKIVGEGEECVGIGLQVHNVSGKWGGVTNAEAQLKQGELDGS